MVSTKPVRGRRRVLIFLSQQFLSLYTHLYRPPTRYTLIAVETSSNPLLSMLTISSTSYNEWVIGHKRKCGRPPKPNEVVYGPTRPRGRPKGSGPKQRLLQDSNRVATQRKARGRPPKEKKGVNIDFNVVSTRFSSLGNILSNDNFLTDRSWFLLCVGLVCTPTAPPQASHSNRCLHECSVIVTKFTIDNRHSRGAAAARDGT